MTGGAIRMERVKKLERLRDAGMNPYPAETKRDIWILDFNAQFTELVEESRPLTIAGRLMSLRGQGGIMFADVFDGTGKTQVVLQKTEMEEKLFQLFADAVDIGDFIEIHGVAFKTKRGEQSLKVSHWKILAKALQPIPSEWYGLKDEELKLRQRYLDILLNDEVRAMFVRRAKFWSAMREYLLKRNFLEVETPILEISPGGADARPFETHHHALALDVSLRISLELWLKRLLVAGFPKVFEIGRIFRNEGQSREHLQDYTQLEVYEAYSDMQKGMKFVQELYRYIVKEVYGKYSFSISGHEVDFAEDWPTMDFSAVMQEHFDIDPILCGGGDAIQKAHEEGVLTASDDNKARAIDSLWKKIRKGIAGPAFLVNVPVYLEPLAKRSHNNPNTVERFQVILAGSEMGKGFSELNDPIDQRARFEEQMRLREAGDSEAQMLDEDFLEALEYGMPPAAGFGISERLFAVLADKPVREATLFPLMKEESK